MTWLFYEGTMSFDFFHKVGLLLDQFLVIVREGQRSERPNIITRVVGRWDASYNIGFKYVCLETLDLFSISSIITYGGSVFKQ